MPKYVGGYGKKTDVIQRCAIILRESITTQEK